MRAGYPGPALHSWGPGLGLVGGGRGSAGGAEEEGYEQQRGGVNPVSGEMEWPLLWPLLLFLSAPCHFI